MSSANWYKVYTRDLQLGLKKNLQDSVVKLIILTTQRIKFSVKHLFNKCEYNHSFIRIYCALICASESTETKMKKKITYFLKNYVGSLFTFFEKVFAICEFFNA